MRTYSIVVKLWTGIVLMTITILFLSMIFQTQFLYTFYINQKAKEVEQLGKDLAKSISNARYYTTVDFNKARKNAKDIIFVTNENAKITYVVGSEEYREGFLFGNNYINRILKGETVVDKNRIIGNLDSLLVGIPIKQKSDNDLNIRYGEMLESSLLVNKISGALYIITPLEPLETTINVIKLQFYYIFIGSILFSSLLAFLLSRSFSKPLIQINDAAKEISKGNYEIKIDLKSSKEIRALGETINNLSRQLSRVEKIRRDFIANVSHELRTPLSYLKGYTEIMLDGLVETDEERNKYLKIILDETERLRKMVDEILLLSQIEAGYVQLKITTFSVEAVVKRLIDKMLPLASKRGISIRFNKIDDDLLLCLGDENRIKQVLINLINNAIKHSYDHGNILISSYRLNDRIYICVRDFGEGISDENLPFIWDRFYTSGKSKSKDLINVGLGLSIVKNIIYAHGCDITVNSVLGEGTEFCFWLPAYMEGQ